MYVHRFNPVFTLFVGEEAHRPNCLVSLTWPWGNSRGDDDEVREPPSP